jgi:hypothetical protein
MQFNTPFPSTATGINNNNNSSNSNASPLMINPISNIAASVNSAAAGTTQLTNINEEAEYNPHLEKVKGFLGRTLRVTISDTRVFEGIFVCTDSHVNLILSMAQEFRQSKFIIQL